jgi:DNA-binding response OmpR family regulator
MGAKSRILVIGTEPGLRFSVTVALRQAGYDAGEAGAGREGIEKLLGARRKGERFSLVVALLQRPGTWILELMDELGRRGVSVPMLAIGDSGEEGLQDRLESRGFTDFLENPSGPEEFLARVALMVNKADRGVG